MATPGQSLREHREKCGLTLRDVENASQEVAKQLKNDEFIVGISTLSDIESKGVTPTIFRVQSLSIIYKVPYTELLRYYGVAANQVFSTELDVAFRKSHVLDRALHPEDVRIPIKVDPAFDLSQTTAISRMISHWGSVPFAFLERLADGDYTYGYIGLDDLSMYPLILPGSFVQIDERLTKVQDGLWASELERPIYFIESRTGFSCCWCSIQGNTIVLQPHPRSPIPARTLKYPQEAEVLGRVVGVAMRLVGWSALPARVPKGHPLQNQRGRLPD